MFDATPPCRMIYARYDARERAMRMMLRRVHMRARYARAAMMRAAGALFTRVTMRCHAFVVDAPLRDTRAL